MSTEKIKVTWDDLDTSASKPFVEEKPHSYSDDVVFQMPQKSTNNPKLWIIIGASIAACLFLILIVCLVVNIFGDKKTSVSEQESSLSQEEKYRKAIESVLEQNASISQTLQGDSTSPKDYFRMVVSIMRSIDLSDCPADFQIAYRNHINATEKLIPILQQQEDLGGFGNVTKSVIIGVISGLTGHFELAIENFLENVYASDELSQAAQAVSKEIDLTAKTFLQIAQKYHVDITPYTQSNN